jgi:hypothetical protein
LPDAAAVAAEEPPVCAHTAGTINNAVRAGTANRIFILTP